MQKQEKDQEHTDETFASLDISLDFTRESLSKLTEISNILDTKANFILGSATLLVSAPFAILATSSSLGHTITLERFLFENIPLAITYMFVVFFAFIGYRLRSFPDAPEPRVLLEQYLHIDELITKYHLLQALVTVFYATDKKVKQKSQAVGFALFFLVLESLTIMLTLVLLAFT